MARRSIIAALVVALLFWTLPLFAAKIQLEDGTTVEGTIEGRFVQKHRESADGGGGYVIRASSVITAIDERGVHLTKPHQVELISTGAMSMRMTGSAEKELDASRLLGELPDGELEASELEKRVIPKLRVKSGDQIVTVAVKDIVDFKK